MDVPLFLRVEDVEKLHAMSLQRFGGSEGLRDRNAFESAVHHPQNIFYCDQGDLFDMAAAYCVHIAQVQAFLDGNKRTGAAAVIVFLDANGYPDYGGLDAYPPRIDRGGKGRNESRRYGRIASRTNSLIYL